MNDTESLSQMTVSGIAVEIVRKEIKNLHLNVLPPNGRVRVSVPLHVSDDHVRAAVVTRLAWIKKQQKEFALQPRQCQREMVTGETHYFLGKRFRLEVVERPGRHSVNLKSASKLQISVQPGTSVAGRQRLLQEWYRQQMKKRIPALLANWQKNIGVQAEGWGVKKMKTKWGSCNITQKRIWLNLELAKKPPACLEYVLVHELVHLHERYHNDRFKQLMDKFLPNWESTRKLLNKEPLGHEDWAY